MVSFNLTIVLLTAKTEANYRNVAPLTHPHPRPPPRAPNYYLTVLFRPIVGLFYNGIFYRVKLSLLYVQNNTAFIWNLHQMKCTVISIVTIHPMQHNTITAKNHNPNPNKPAQHAVKYTLYSLSLSTEKLHIQESSGVLYSWVQTASHSKRVFIFRLVVSCMMTCTDFAYT